MVVDQQDTYAEADDPLAHGRVSRFCKINIIFEKNSLFYEFNQSTNFPQNWFNCTANSVKYFMEKVAASINVKISFGSCQISKLFLGLTIDLVENHQTCKTFIIDKRFTQQVGNIKAHFNQKADAFYIIVNN